MAALVGRIPRPQMRLALLENLGDEHGAGRLTVCHENTFIELLSRLGVERSEVDRRAMWPEVRAFNCDAPRYLRERRRLHRARGARDHRGHVRGDLRRDWPGRSSNAGWLKRREIVHYTTHETLDVAARRGILRVALRAVRTPRPLALPDRAGARARGVRVRAPLRRPVARAGSPAGCARSSARTASRTESGWKAPRGIRRAGARRSAESRDARQAGTPAASAPSTPPATTVPMASAGPMSK